MTTTHIVDPADLLGEAFAKASPDLIRHLLQIMFNAILVLRSDVVCGAECILPTSPDRLTLQRRTVTPLHGT